MTLACFEFMNSLSDQNINKSHLLEELSSAEHLFDSSTQRNILYLCLAGVPKVYTDVKIQQNVHLELKHFIKALYWVCFNLSKDGKEEIKGHGCLKLETLQL